MQPTKDLSKSEDKDIKGFRRQKENKLAKLSDYKQGYTTGNFIPDLEIYFEGEVDFNVEKIQQLIEVPGRLDRFIKEATKKNTHPVAEFVQELFKELFS